MRRARAQLVPASDVLRRSADDPALLRTAAGRAALRNDLVDAAAQLSSARDTLRGSLPLTLVRPLPFVGRQRSATIHLVDDAHAVAAEGVRLLRDVERLVASPDAGATIVPLDAVDALGAGAQRAATVLRAAVRPPAGLAPPLASARRELNDAIRSAVTRLERGSETLGALAPFLGGSGTRRYFLAVENNAEMRARGMVLSYGIVSATDGAIEFTRTGSVHDIELDRPVDVALPEGTAQLFGALEPGRFWQNTNATPDFDLSSRLQVAMWQQATGEAVDGVIAVDVPGLAALLGVVGPVDVEGSPEALTAENVARVLLKDFYDRFSNGDQAPRRERLADAAGAVVAALTASDADPVALAEAVGTAAARSHIRLWSTVPAETAAFERVGLSGGPAVEDPDRTFHVSVQNATPSKLDYYVRPAVEMDVVLTPGGSAVVRTTVTVSNGAPAGGGSSYQLGPHPPKTRRAGQYVGRVYVWGPRGADQLGAIAESGLQVSGTVLSVLPGESAQTTVTTVIPDAVRDGRLELRLVPQPRLEPAGLRVCLSAPDRTVTGDACVAPTFDTTVRLRWHVQ